MISRKGCKKIAKKENDSESAKRFHFFMRGDLLMEGRMKYEYP